MQSKSKKIKHNFSCQKCDLSFACKNKQGIVFLDDKNDISIYFYNSLYIKNRIFIKEKGICFSSMEEAFGIYEKYIRNLIFE